MYILSFRDIFAFADWRSTIEKRNEIIGQREHIIAVFRIMKYYQEREKTCQCESVQLVKYTGFSAQYRASRG